MAAKGERPTGGDAGRWAKPTPELHLGDVPLGALNLNVEGRRVAGLVGGFGRMWRKTYRVALEGLETTPEDVVRTWKESFGSFWPRRTRFYAPLSGIAPGEVALLNVEGPVHVRAATGVLVAYVDDVSFTYMTPEGHPFAGMITFSASAEDGVLVAQVQAYIRAQDPLYELGMALGGHRAEDAFWGQTLRNLARSLGVSDPRPTTKRECLDRRRQWRYARGIRYNAVLRSAAYLVSAPFRALRRRRAGRTPEEEGGPA